MNYIYNQFTEKERNHLLEFSSNFEGGNLYAAYKIAPFEYELVL